MAGSYPSPTFLTVSGPVGLSASGAGLTITAPTMTSAGTATVIGEGAGINLAPGAIEATIIGNHAGGSSANVGGGTGLTGAECTLIGWHSGTQMTSGGFNTGIGVNTLGFTTTGSINVAIGTDSMRNSITSSNNTCIGVNTMHDGGQIDNSIAIGVSALYSVSTASAATRLIAIGNNAMVAPGLTTAADSIAIGDGAGAAVVSFSECIMLGVQAGSNLQSGVQNILIGSGAGSTMTAQGNNVLIGHHSGQQVAANDLTAVGNQTFETGLAASSVAIGSLALRGGAGANGTNNIAIGFSAMGGAAMTTAGSNVAIGSAAVMATITTGAQNVAIGTATGGAITSANESTLVGSGAGFKITVSTGNTMIGMFAGRLATGDHNTLLGDRVGSVTLAGGTGNIFIGCSATMDAATGGESNTFRLGNHATNIVRVTAINTASPAFFLDWLPGSTTFANDAAAATGGVAVGQIYRNGSVMQCRIT